MPPLLEVKEPTPEAPPIRSRRRRRPERRIRASGPTSRADRTAWAKRRETRRGSASRAPPRRDWDPSHCPGRRRLGRALEPGSQHRQGAPWIRRWNPTNRTRAPLPDRGPHDSPAPCRSPASDAPPRRTADGGRAWPPPRFLDGAPTGLEPGVRKQGGPAAAARARPPRQPRPAASRRRRAADPYGPEMGAPPPQRRAGAPRPRRSPLR